MMMVLYIEICSFLDYHNTAFRIYWLLFLCNKNQQNAQFLD